MNKVILMGRLVKDPDFKIVGDNKARALFTLAVNRRYAAQGGQSVADFPNIICWEHTAEFAQKFLKKGMRIVVEGSLQTRTYDAQDGTKRFLTEVMADHIEFCESKREGQQNASESMPVNGRDARFDVMDPNDDQLPF